MDEDKRLFVAAQLLPSLILDREKERNYTRERAVEIAINYTDLLIKKLAESSSESKDNRRLVVERDTNGKKTREGLLNEDCSVEWVVTYS